MAPQQMFRAAMSFLADADPNARPWRMPLTAEVRGEIDAVRAQQRRQREKEGLKRRQEAGGASPKSVAAPTAGVEGAAAAGVGEAGVGEGDGADAVARAMQKAFAVVFLDGSGVFNLAGRVSDSGWAELQNEVRGTTRPYPNQCSTVGQSQSVAGPSSRTRERDSEEE